MPKRVEKKKKEESKLLSGVGKEVVELSKIVSGEVSLRANEKKLEELRKVAIKEQKKRARDVIIKDKIKAKVEEGVIQGVKLYEWEAPVRLQIEFDMKIYLLVIGISLILILLLAILGHYGLMAAIIALLFVIYVAGTTKPIIVKHKITARGVDTLDVLYEWFMLNEFWFTVKEGQNILNVSTKLRYPAKLILLLNKEDRVPVFLLLQKKLLYKEMRKQGRVDKLTFGDYIPLEKV